MYFQNFPPQLFDVKNDEDEFWDLGRDPACEDKRRDMHERLLQRLLKRKNRVALTDESIDAIRGSEHDSGIRIGQW